MSMALFKQSNFVITTVSGLIIGLAMFGALAYLPTFLQMVTGANATQTGLLMIPMMGGLLLTSISSGAYVSRTGRYKWFPVVGTSIVACALALLSTMNADLPIWTICSYLALLGIGLGLCMQILVLNVQNTFPRSQVGMATASNNYFRQIGASLGTAAVGRLFVTNLGNLLKERLPAAGGVPAGAENSLTPDLVRTLPEGIRHVIVGSYSDALTQVFLYMVPLVVAATLVLVFLKEKPLATTLDRDAAESSATAGNESANALKSLDQGDPGELSAPREPRHRA